MTSEQPPILEVSRLRSEVLTGLREYYLEHGVMEVRPPLLVDVTGACENVDTLLAVWGSLQAESAPSHQVQRGYLSQTSQLALEIVLAKHQACWCQTISFRDDAPNPRHLRDFELVEEEFGADTQSDSVDSTLRLFDQLLDRIQSVLRAGIMRALDTGAAAAIGADVKALEAALGLDFPRVTYDDAIEMANAARAGRQEPLLEWGQDLKPVDEVAIIQGASGDHAQPLPTFVTLFPCEIKFFNMKLDPRDPRKVLSADALLPFAGEAVGAAVREDDYEILTERLVSSTMFKTLQARNIATLEAFRPYLKLIQTMASPRHAGYGIGLERLLQFVAGLSDIRETSLAYRLTMGETSG